MAGGGGVCGWCIIAESCVDDEQGWCVYPENHVSKRGVGAKGACPAKGEELKWLDELVPPFFMTVNEESEVPEESVGGLLKRAKLTAEETKHGWADTKLDEEIKKLRMGMEREELVVTRASLLEFFKENVPKMQRKVEDLLVGPGREGLKKRLLDQEVKRHVDSVNRILTQFTVAKAHGELLLYMLEAFDAEPATVGRDGRVVNANIGDTGSDPGLMIGDIGANVDVGANGASEDEYLPPDEHDLSVEHDLSDPSLREFYGGLEGGWNGNEHLHRYKQERTQGGEPGGGVDGAREDTRVSAENGVGIDGADYYRDGGDGQPPREDTDPVTTTWVRT
jgi:hypothetical protein